MKSRFTLIVAIASILLLPIFFGSMALAAVQDPAPDKILVNGKIVTVDKNFSIVEAVAVKDGRFVGVGSNQEIGSLAGPGTEVIDLHGKTVVPGFIDGHAHMDREGLKFAYPSLDGVRSIDDILKVIEREVQTKKPGEWVVTMPIGDYPFFSNVPGILKEKRFPNRRDLDKVSPNNPVYIRSIWGYWDKPPIASIANSYALRLAGITRDPQPPYDGITIEKDPATGEPTGVISEKSFVPSVEFSLMKVVPRFTHEIRVAGLKESMKRYNAVGTTSTYEGHGISSEVIRAYKELWAKGELTVRSHLLISPTPGKAVKPDLDEMIRDWAAYADGPGFGDDMLRISGIFLQSGGSPHVARLRIGEGPYTAWAAYYVDAPTPEQFRNTAEVSAKYGLRVNAITADQKSLDATLAAYEDVNKTFSLPGRRWVVEHLLEVTPKNIEQMKQLGVIPTVIPTKQVSISGIARLKTMPQEKQANLAPYKSMIEAGLPLVLASDNVPINPFNTLWAAVARKDWQSGELCTPAEKLSREQALRAMTINGAYLSFQENVKGSIEKGKYADLAVLNKDYLTVPEDEIRDIKVLMTIVGGKIVHRTGESMAMSDR